MYELINYKYLPVYNSSCRNEVAKTVVITVQSGLKMAEDTGPLCDMHHVWRKLKR